jgi:hypothetical protein
MRRLVEASAVLAILVSAACGSGSSGGDGARSGHESASTPCERAREAFAAIDDLHDTLEDAIPTLHACSDFNEWDRVGNATSGHNLVVAKVTAKNLCRFQSGTQGAPVCESL